MGSLVEGLACQCSPDGAERNPGTIEMLHRRFRIALRSIRATLAATVMADA